MKNMKFMVSVLAASIFLTGCITSKDAIGDRETLPENSPYLGYWIDAPDADGTCTVMSIFRENSETLLVAWAKKAYTLAELADADKISKDDATISRVYLSKKRTAPAAHSTAEGFASLRYLNNPNITNYEIGHYRLVKDGTLEIYYGDQTNFGKALKTGLVKDGEYEPVTMELRQSPERLLGFVNGYDGFFFTGAYRKVSLTAEEINQKGAELGQMYYVNDLERKLAALTIPGSTYEKSMSFVPYKQYQVLAAALKDEQRQNTYEVYYLPEGNFKDLVADEGRLKQWVEEWGKESGMQAPTHQRVQNAGETTMIAIGGVHSEYLKMQAMVFENRGQVCVVKNYWPSYETSNEDDYEPLKNLVRQMQA